MRRARHAPNLLARKGSIFTESTADEHTAFRLIESNPTERTSTVPPRIGGLSNRR